MNPIGKKTNKSCVAKTLSDGFKNVGACLGWAGRVRRSIEVFGDMNFHQEKDRLSQKDLEGRQTSFYCI